MDAPSAPPANKRYDTKVAAAQPGFKQAAGGMGGGELPTPPLAHETGLEVDADLDSAKLPNLSPQDPAAACLLAGWLAGGAGQTTEAQIAPHPPVRDCHYIIPNSPRADGGIILLDSMHGGTHGGLIAEGSIPPTRLRQLRPRRWHQPPSTRVEALQRLLKERQR